jgi:hypothetical protein
MKMQVLVWCAAALVATAAGAADPAAPEETPAATAPATTAPAPGDAAKRPPHPYCLKATGSRIPAKEGECVPGSGRVITREEMDRTGATSVGEAIHQLTPY